VVPRADVSEERRAQIIAAALACFTRKGYVHTTMDDIVTESGLSKGALYWYFKSKEELFTAAMTSCFEGFGETSFATLDDCESTSSKLRVITTALADLWKDAEGLFSLFIEFWTQSAQRAETAKVWMEMLSEYKDSVVAIIEEGVKSGEFKPVDAESLVWAALAAYDGLAVYAALMPALDLTRISDVFVETLLGGLETGN
jgi:AcrR family transcriptional regulator